jgi:hypothetical protein
LPNLQRNLNSSVVIPAPLIRQNSLLLEPSTPENGSASVSPKGGSSPKNHVDSPTPQQTSKSSTGFTPKGPIGVLPEAVQVEILSIVLQKPEYSNGIVIDGLKTAYGGSLETTAASLAQAIPLANKKACFMVLQTDINTIRSRKSQLFYAEENKVQEQLKQMALVSETEYDEMTSEEQAVYETTRSQLKQQRREAQERRKKEMIHFNLSLREQERAEEEKILLASKKATAGITSW